MLNGTRVIVRYLPKLAEAQGFEPWIPCGMPVFKTGAIDHSAKLPLHCSR